MNKTLKKLRNRAIFVLAAAAIVGVYLFISNSYTMYGYAHLTPVNDYGRGTDFTPMAGEAEAGNMQPAASNDILTLYVDPVTSNIAVLDKRNGQMWYSSPPGAATDAIANNFEKGVMQSMVGIRYYNEQRRRFMKWSYSDAADKGQFELQSIPDGVRVIYSMGDLSLGIDACPRYLTNERFQERVMDQLEDSADKRFMQRVYIPSRTKEGFMEILGGVRDHPINAQKTIDLFEKLGYTMEELEEDNETAEYELEVDTDIFSIELEFVIKGDTLTANLPLSNFSGTEDARLYSVEFLRYFGAGGMDEEGYLLVPSGSGALINFNNGKTNEEAYIGPIYGLDLLMNTWMPQIYTPARLPLFGIKKENAAMLAYVENGAAMATVNADIAARNSSYNNAYFTFLVRDFLMLALATGSESDMTVVQAESYMGDLTVNYCFTANEDADYVGMALAYQKRLMEKGVLAPLAPAENTPFYLDILGAVEKLKFIMGTPYRGIVSMTTYDQAADILMQLQDNGVHSVQMRWQGWFNRGLDHDIAKTVKPISYIGSRNEMHELNALLKQDGGGLYPSVNFQIANYYSKGIKLTYEVSRDPAGYVGTFSDYKREFLNFMGGPGLNNWHVLITPLVLPFHIDKFIPAYNKMGVDTLALGDLGDVLSGSIYRKDFIDREHSRLVVTEQLTKLSDTYKSLMIAGGNDYALGAASHIVGAPLEMDRFYILDHEVPFYEIVVHGFIDYAGLPVNTREVQDPRYSFLTDLATGASPRYQWSYQPTRAIEGSSFEHLYSTHYINWFGAAADQYREYNDIYKSLRTQRITGHEILSESAKRATAVTMTEYEDGTRIYVNTGAQAYERDGVTVPARGYTVKGGRLP